MSPVRSNQLCIFLIALTTAGVALFISNASHKGLFYLFAAFVSCQWWTLSLFILPSRQFKLTNAICFFYCLPCSSVVVENLRRLEIHDREIYYCDNNTRGPRRWIDGHVFIFRPNTILAASPSFHCNERGQHFDTYQHDFAALILAYCNYMPTMHGILRMCSEGPAWCSYGGGNSRN